MDHRPSFSGADVAVGTVTTAGDGDGPAVSTQSRTGSGIMAGGATIGAMDLAGTDKGRGNGDLIQCGGLRRQGRGMATAAVAGVKGYLGGMADVGRIGMDTGPGRSACNMTGATSTAHKGTGILPQGFGG